MFMVDVRRLQHDDLGDLIPLSRAFFAEYAGYHWDFFRLAMLNDEDIVAYFSGFWSGTIAQRSRHCEMGESLGTSLSRLERSQPIGKFGELDTSRD
jgi:hypothetical protein